MYLLTKLYLDHGFILVYRWMSMEQFHIIQQLRMQGHGYRYVYFDASSHDGT